MIKKISLRKLMISTAVLFTLLLVTFLPKEPEPLSLKQELQYASNDYLTSSIFLLNDESYLGKTKVVVSSDEVTVRAKELLQVLIVNGKGEAKIPSGFKPILPSDTKILSLTYDNKIIKVNFSKDLLDISKELEEKMIESVVYTLTSIPEVDGVIIFVEGDILSKLPQTKINLPSTLDRSFGINKEYDLTSTKDITKVTIYYLDRYNDSTYYVPVTKYLNDQREKIDIIVDQLSSTNLHHSNLMSYLSKQTKILAVEQADNILKLDFNEAIFSDIDEKNILEEVMYTIAYSVYDNYDVEEVVFLVDQEEICKSVLKTID